ncbi:hypothetical protein [Pseudomonas sp. LB3P31]
MQVELIRCLLHHKVATLLDNRAAQVTGVMMKYTKPPTGESDLNPASAGFFINQAAGSRPFFLAT